MTKRNTQNRGRPARPKPSPAAKERVTQVLDVVDVAFGGDGIARVDGKVIFIEGAVPGEKVEAEILLDKKRFAKARAIARVESAPDEAQAFCPVFSRCGGCDWQHVPYAKQLEWKRQFIASALQKTAGIASPENLAIRPSRSLRNFRNRIRLKARLHKGRMAFGYFAKGSHDLVGVGSCPIADEPINRLMDGLTRFAFEDSLRWQGDVELQVIADGRCLANFNPPFPDLKRLRESFPAVDWAPEGSVLFEVHEGFDYRTRAGQFQQVNVEGNHALREWIRAKVRELRPATLVDMFSGSGNLSLGLSREAFPLRVWGIEYSTSAIASAEDNMLANGISGFQYRAGPANQIREIFPDLPGSIDCVITDPPRQGMDDSLEDLLDLKPKHILSVSCDPNTFARDLRILLSRGYKLRDIMGMDFFPHSYHIETLAHLEYSPEGLQG